MSERIKTKSKLICFLLLLFTVLSVSAQEENDVVEFSLKEAQNYALQNSINIKLKDTEIEVANEQLNEIRSIGLPSLNGSLRYNYYITIPKTILPATFNPLQELVQIETSQGTKFIQVPVLDPQTGAPQFGEPQEVAFGTKHTLNAGLEATQMIFNGSYFVGLEASKELKKRVNEEKVQAEDELKFAITQAYFSALIVKEQIALLEKNKENLEQILFETSQLYENGFVEVLDVDRLRLSLSNLSLQIENTKRSHQLSLESLKFQMGYVEENEISLVDSLSEIIPDIESMKVEDLKVNPRNRAEYRVLERTENLNKLDIKNISWQRLPNLTAFGTYQQNFQQDSLRTLFKGDFWTPAFLVGFQLNVPILAGGERKAQIAQRKLRAVQIEQSKELLKQSFNIEMEQARLNYKNALAQVQSQQENISLAERIYSTALIKYKEGLGSSLEVSTAERELFQTQSLYINALYSLVVEKNNLDRALGNF